MSSATRTTRARRGRVMVVGELPELSHVLPQLQQSPLQVQNLFEALGEVTIASASAPISTILIPEILLHSKTAHAIESLRKIDPALRVVVIAPKRREPSNGDGVSATDWTNKGADECIVLPLRPEDVNRLFEDDVIASTPTSEPSPPPLSQPVADPVSNSSHTNVFEIDSTPEDEHVADTPIDEFVLNVEFPNRVSPIEPAAAPADAQPLHAPSSAPPPVESAVSKPAESEPQNSQNLGDTDLIDALMIAPQRLRDVAMQLIVQQTSWSDLSILQRDEDVDSDSTACVEVACAGRHFCKLTTAQATAQQLQPWADWLARWLDLDQSYTHYRTLAFRDDLTSAWNRRFFETFLSESISRASKSRRPVTVMVFDIDNFKSYNDNFGHDAGDEVLRETVRLLNSVIRQGDRVCRIGGDEFAVIFADPEAPRELGSSHPESVEVIAKRFQDQICKMRFPKLGQEAPGNLSISAGLATYPWDGRDAATLLRHADQLALQSKRSGKNAIAFGPGAQNECRQR